MVWTKEGEPVHGLTGGHWRDRRAEFAIPKSWKTGQEHFFTLSVDQWYVWLSPRVIK